MLTSVFFSLSCVKTTIEMMPTNSDLWKYILCLILCTKATYDIGSLYRLPQITSVLSSLWNYYWKSMWKIIALTLTGQGQQVCCKCYKNCHFNDIIQWHCDKFSANSNIAIWIKKIKSGSPDKKLCQQLFGCHHVTRTRAIDIFSFNCGFQICT